MSLLTLPHKTTYQVSSNGANQPLIELSNVAKVYKTSAGEYHALKNINLSFHKGEFTSIIGKSGSGKSTLINMITGIDHPTAGSVRVGEALIHKMSQGKLAVWRGRNLGVVFQFFQLLPLMSVLENTMLPMDFCNMYARQEREARAMELLKQVGLEDIADKLPAALSGGQQQMAAIARALANDPPILVADEPTGNLDSRTAEHILQIFGELAAQGKTILIVTHDPGLARRTARRVLISDGELINEWVAQALPMLTHPQMLKTSHQAIRRTFEPGATLARQGAAEFSLYVVTHGQVEVIRQGRGGTERVIGHLHPGQYFSALEMVETQYCDLHFRAAPDEPVQTLCLEQEPFNGLLNSTTTSHALRQAAIERSALYCPNGTYAQGEGR